MDEYGLTVLSPQQLLTQISVYVEMRMLKAEQEPTLASRCFEALGNRQNGVTDLRTDGCPDRQTVDSEE